MNNPIVPEDPLDNKIKNIMEGIQNALRPNAEDPEQKSLIEAIQLHRSMILDAATSAYLNRTHDPKLLEALSSLISQLEKSVRDDRKERSKQQEQQENKLAFKQVVEALGSLSTGKIALPSFGDGFSFDPLAEQDETKYKIKENELVMGHIALDFDGNQVK